MNAAIGFCVFCEVHGPKLVFCTQTLRDFENRTTSELPYYGPRSSLQNCPDPGQRNEQRCEGCSSLGNVKYLSNDHKARSSFLSAQQPISHEVEKLLNYACVRSLSCEVHSGKEGVCYFGDEIRGHVLSITFTLKDTQARGFRRWCSFIVLTRDKQFLLNLWPFLTENLTAIIKELQDFSKKKYNVEGNEFSQRAARLAMTPNDQKSSKMSSIADITAEKYIFVRIHLWLTWILSAGARQFIEKLPENNLGNVLNPETKLADSTYSVPEFKEIGEKSPVSILRSLKKNLGAEQFRRVLYATLTGVQILIRGPRSYTLELLYSLCFLVPKTFHKVAAVAVEYVDKSCYNFIGVDSKVAVPLLCEDVCRLDIVSTNESQTLVDYFIRWLGILPKKLPTLLVKIEKSLDNEFLVDSVLKMHLKVLQEEWTNFAKMFNALKNRDDNEIDLIKSLGGGSHDKKLLDAWSRIS